MAEAAALSRENNKKTVGKKKERRSAALRRELNSLGFLTRFLYRMFSFCSFSIGEQRESLFTAGTSRFAIVWQRGTFKRHKMHKRYAIEMRYSKTNSKKNGDGRGVWLMGVEGNQSFRFDAEIEDALGSRHYLFFFVTGNLRETPSVQFGLVLRGSSVRPRNTKHRSRSIAKK